MSISKFVATIALVLMPLMGLSAQSLEKNSSPQNKTIEIKRLIAQEQFNAARRMIENMQNDNSIDALTTPAELQYLKGYCDLRLEREGGEEDFVVFAQNHDGTLFGSLAWLDLGNVKFAKNDFAKAKIYYAKIIQKQLPREKIGSYNLNYGYACYVLSDAAKAEALFASELKRTKGKSIDANYYTACLQQDKGDLATAQKTFETLVENEKFGYSAKIHLIQIAHLQQNNEYVLTSAKLLLTTDKNESNGELSRMLGSNYFAKNDYPSAIEYYTKYKQLSSGVKTQEMYNLGVAYYQTAAYDKACEAFSLAVTGKDLLAQSAYNYLGASYLKRNDKTNARMAFEAASNMTFDKMIQEESMFNFAKLTFETGHSPFNQILDVFERYIKEFPNSNNTPEAYKLLSEVFLSTKNYQRAYESLMRVTKPNATILESLQRVAYYRAIELFNDGKYSESLPYFTKSIQNNSYDPKIKAQAYFWRGESYYRLSDFKNAINDFNTCFKLPGFRNYNEYLLASYSMGYALFKTMQYDASIQHFVNLSLQPKSVSNNMLGDSYCRVADCYYLKKDFSMAIYYYDQAIKTGAEGSDYAMYQKAQSNGIKKDNNAKITILKQLISLYPQSTYADNAYYQIGQTYALTSNFPQAIVSYNEFVEKYPSSSLVSTAMLDLALAYTNNNQLDLASKTYKQVVASYSGTAESRSALNSLKSISIELNEVQNFVDYTKTLGANGQLSINEEDSITYMAAEKIFISENYGSAKSHFASYIERFPNGAFIANALYYKASAHVKLKETQNAVDDFLRLTEMPNSQFTEDALATVSPILYAQKEFVKALACYQKLEVVAQKKENRTESIIGIMRSIYYLNDFENALTVAQKALSLNLDDLYTREIRFIRAKSLYALQRYNESLADFKVVGNDTRNIMGAESKYLTAKILFDNKKLDDAATEVFDFIQKNTPHQYWLAKAFIVLSDVYIAKNDDFQAKQYLISLKQNYKTTTDDILGEIESRLAPIEQRELQRQQSKIDSLKRLLNSGK